MEDGKPFALGNEWKEGKLLAAGCGNYCIKTHRETVGGTPVSAGITKIAWKFKLVTEIESDSGASNPIEIIFCLKARSVCRRTMGEGMLAR